jgi:transcriptional regulator with XRE-family HTH domain
MNLGQATKLMRTASGLRQKEIADQLGVTANYISLIENGKREPSVAFLRHLAKALGVPVGLFFLWEETESKSSKTGVDQLRDILTQLETMYVVANRRKIQKGQAV